MTYYKQTDTITYDKADDLVEEYVEEYGEQKTYVTAREVCLKMGIEPSQHNQHRVYSALSDRFDVPETWSSSPQKFKVEA